MNPFGLCCDPYLNLYTADCHSKPITQLIRHATYQSFAKPHDGLGFAPHVTNHSHGSTALCGLEWYSDTRFPKEFQNCMFLGNVVTNRINADRMTFRGSTPVAEELPDFLTSSDPWFRPTDIKLGMDGALYFADFYNRIIGHYEVKLDHPQRDKDRGRIWRIVYTGKGVEPETVMRSVVPLRKLGPVELSNVLTDSTNLTTRLLAFHELVLRTKTNKMGEIAPDLSPESAFAIYTLSFVKDDIAKSYEQMLKTNGMPMRQFAAKPEWSEEDRANAIKGFENNAKSAWTLRALIDGITQHPHADFVLALLKFIPTIPAEDTHLKCAARVALRDCLETDTECKNWPKLNEEPPKLEREVLHDRIQVLVDSGLGCTSIHVLKGMLYYMRLNQFPSDFLPAFYYRVGRYGDDDQRREMAGFTNRNEFQHPKECLQLIRGMQDAGWKPVKDTSVMSRWILWTTSKALGFGAMEADPATTKEPAEDAKNLFFEYRKLVDVRSAESFAEFQKGVQNVAASKNATLPQRLAAVEIMIGSGLGEPRPSFDTILGDPEFPADARERMLSVLVRNRPTAHEANLAKEAIKTAKYASALDLAVGLASDSFGADLLLLAVKNGEAPVRLLQEKAVLDRLKAAGVRDLDSKVKDLTAGLPSPEKRIDDLIKKRAAAFPKAKADAALGKAVFSKHCAICHTIGNDGAKVGPQLDGVGIRGMDRLIEDTLDPSRNVDAAFRATTFDMADGRTVVGLLSREEGAVYVVFDAQGKEQRLAKDDVLKKKASALSAMPANVDALVPEKDYFDLLAYLLTQKPK